MGSGRRKQKGRREPRFDAFPIPGFGLRLSARDRVGGPPAGDRAERRAVTAREERRAASEDPPPRPRDRDEKPAPQPTSRRSGDGGGKRRSLLGRLFYWGIVLGLWGVIAGIGVF